MGPFNPAAALGGMDERKRRLMGQMGVGPALPPQVAAAQQAMMQGMNAAGPPPAVFQPPPGATGMQGLPPSGNPFANRDAMLAAGPAGDMAAAAQQQAMMMAPPPAPNVGALPTGPPPALADQIRQDYLSNMKAPMQNARPPVNKLAAGLNALGMAGAGLSAAGNAGTGPALGAAGAGAGLGMMGQYLKDRRGKKTIGTGAFAEGGVVRMAMGGAAKTRKDYPKTGPLPKKNEFAYPLDPVHSGKKSRGMGAAVRGHNFKGSL